MRMMRLKQPSVSLGPSSVYGLPTLAVEEKPGEISRKK